MNRKTRAILSLAVLLSLGTAAPVWASEAPPAPQVQQQEPDFVTTADQAIRDARTVGFVDTDGSKLKAIVLAYDRPIPAAAVDVSTFAIEDYGMTLREQDLTQGTSPGALKRVYVNDVPDTDAAGGKASGSYVILEVNTDYQTGRFPRSYAITMYAGVTQQKAIRTAEGIILPSDQAVTNYTKETYVGYDPQTGKRRPPESYNYAKEGGYQIKGIEEYQLHTIEDGTAFHATHCFDEANGKYWDFDLPYALYVPADYSPQKKCGLVLHIHDAGS